MVPQCNKNQSPKNQSLTPPKQVRWAPDGQLGRGGWEEGVGQKKENKHIIHEIKDYDKLNYILALASVTVCGAFLLKMKI